MLDLGLHVGLPAQRPPRPRASSAAFTAASIASSSSSGGSSPPSGTTSVLHLRGHVGEDLDRDRVAADALDRIGEVDLPPVDADLELLPDLVGDVGRGHRAEEDSLRAGVHVEAKLGLAQLLGDLLRVLEALRLVARALRLALLELGHAGRRRLLGEPPRPEVVAQIAARDRDDIAAQADLLHVFQEDDVHRAYPET